MAIRILEKGTIIHRPAGMFFWSHLRGVNGVSFGETDFWFRKEAQSSGRVIATQGSLVIIDFGEKFHWIANIGQDLEYNDRTSQWVLACKFQRDTDGYLEGEYNNLHDEYAFIRNKGYDEKRYNEGKERARLLQMIDDLTAENHKLRLEKIGVSE